MTETMELIDAFADGERVHPDALKAALADPAARDYLVDLLALRGLVQDHVSLDAPLATPAAASPARSSGRWLRPVAAIAIVGLAAWAGFAVGRRGQQTAPTTSSAVVTAPAAVDNSAAPEPTRVIRLQQGVEWRERAGGH